MKKYIILIFVFAAAFSCKNRSWEFDDFGRTTSYFPFQYPVRTLVLGNYMYDNTNDNNHRFLISAGMGGVYENKTDRQVNFVIDETLTNNLYTGSVKIDPLPQQYYTLSDNGKIVIPKGSFTGGVTVQLTDAFFNDPLAITTKYVIPLQIVSATTDSVINGNPARQNPDKRIAGHWIVAPKDFTLFGVNFVNEYHGKYLLRGRDLITSSVDGSQVDMVVYRNQYVEKSELVMVYTSGLKTTTYSNNVRSSTTSPGKFNVIFTFDGNNNCTIKESSGFPVAGTGKLVKDGDEWGGKKRDVILLSYKITEGSRIHTVNDTLVFRDKAVVLQEFTPTIK